MVESASLRRSVQRRRDTGPVMDVLHATCQDRHDNDATHDDGAAAAGMGRQHATTIPSLAIPLLLVRQLAFGLGRRRREMACRFPGATQADPLSQVRAAQMGGG